MIKNLLNLSGTVLLILTILFLGGCATIERDPNDPFEPVNRFVYGFNNAVDKLYIKPPSLLYSMIVPRPIRNSVGNFFSNVGEVPTIANDILQFRFDWACNDFARLFINTTIGVVGMFDVASNLGFESNHQDFGMTLTRWGYKGSSYLVLPILGPSTIRDTIAMPVNVALSPQHYLEPKWRNRYIIAETIHKRSELQDVADLVTTAGVDKYVMIRNAYLQRKDHLQSKGEATKDSELLGEPPE